MAQCDECGCYDDNHAEILDYPAGMEDDDQKQQEWLEEQEDYEPHRYYYWHADIQEDYQMPAGYECLCERCFGTFLNAGEIIEKYDDLTGKPNPKWNDDEMGWFIPYVEETHGT